MLASVIYGLRPLALSVCTHLACSDPEASEALPHQDARQCCRSGGSGLCAPPVCAPYGSGVGSCLRQRAS